MATITVRNASELNSALSRVDGGDTILLANGNYGAISLSKDFSSTVTIKAINPLGATFRDIDVPGGSHIHIDGVKIQSQPRIDKNAHHITISNSELQSGLYFIDADNVVVHNNDIGNARNVLTLNDVTNFTITENYIHHATSDMVRITGASKNGVFENNSLYDVNAHRPDHPDMIQLFGTGDGTPSDIVFRGNHMYDDPSTGSVNAQGFFFGNPGSFGFRNLLVEQNLISVGSPNSIYVNGGTANVIVRENTLIPWPGDAGGIIRIAERSGLSNAGTQVIDNVAKEVLHETGDARIVGNYEYGRNANLSQLFSGDGDTWQDFVPRGGSPIALSTGRGATERLQELMNGATPGPVPDNNAVSIPTPTPTATQLPAAVAPSASNDRASTSATTPQAPTPDRADGAAFFLKGDHEFNGQAGNVYEYAHSNALALSSGTLALTFNADTVSGLRGLVSKDAAGFAGGGDHFTSYIQNGTLIIRFQDGNDSKIFVKSGIRANTDYDLQVSIGGGRITASLDGETFGNARFDTSWAGNTEYLQIGANGWGSQAGRSGFEGVFDGTISNVLLVPGVQSYAQMQATLRDALSPPAVAQPPSSNASSNASVDPGAGYYLAGNHEFSRASDVIQVAPNADLKLASGSVSLTFNADTVAGYRGILSKDAAGFSGSGQHFTSYIKDGTLVIRFQDGDSSQIFTKTGIRANRDYDLEINFSTSRVTATLDGQTFGQARFDGSWLNNNEYLQIGANGWGSQTGRGGFTDVFDGTISNVLIVGQGQSTPTTTNAPTPTSTSSAASSETVSYAAATSAVTARLDGGVNGGAARGDNLRDTENLIGSRFNDLLIGDEQANTLYGRSGNDTMNGGHGNDIMHGESGNDRMSGGSGNDRLWGGSGNDLIWGNTGNDRVDGGTGHDTLYGESGTDTIVGADGNDHLFGGAGNDLLNGGSNNDVLTGGHGGDVLLGFHGSDRLYGSAGNDTLNGGSGNDLLFGQSGSDTYRFDNGFGRDAIYGFEARNNAEKIDLSAVWTISSFWDLKNHHLSRSGSDVVIDAGGGNTIRLVGTNYADLDHNDFIF